MVAKVANIENWSEMGLKKFLSESIFILAPCHWIRYLIDKFGNIQMSLN